MRYRLALSLKSLSCALIVAALGLAAPAGAKAQSTCPNLNGPTCFLPTANVSLTAPATLITVITPQPPPLPPSVCVVEEDGYLRAFTLARVDVAATTTGGCDHRFWGQYFYTQLYGLNWIFWWQVSPTLVGLPNFAPAQPQIIDTTFWPDYVGGSGGQTFSRSTPGAYQLAFQTGALAGNCQLPTLSGIVQRNINVVACKPTYWDELQSALPGARLPAGEIDLYLPSSMSGARTALDAAVLNWNNALAGPDLPHLNVVTTACNTSLPTCVTISTGGLGTACGLTDGDRSGGLFTGNVTLKLDATWNVPPYALTPTGLQRTFSHEIGHLLGLWDFACSDVSHAAMADNFVCQQEVILTEPTFTDIQPVIKALYGSKTRLSCGF